MVRKVGMQTTKKFNAHPPPTSLPPVDDLTDVLDVDSEDIDDMDDDAGEL